MKRMDDAFYALYQQHETKPAPESGEPDTITIYQNVLRKAGLAPASRRGRKRVSRTLLIAAALAAAALSTAAAVYGIRDAFRGALTLHDSADSSSGSILERTGQLVEESQSSGTVDISLRAAAGDERTLKVLVDVVDRSGKGLSILQPDQTRSGGSFALKDYSIKRANGEPLAGGANYTLIESDPGSGKFAILFDYSVMGDSIRGETLRLHFEDILQSASQDGTALDMEPDDLYRLVSGFGEYQDSDFRLSSNVDGKKSYLLDVPGAREGVALGKGDTGLQVTAATVRDGALYLQGTAGSDSSGVQALERVALAREGSSTILASDYGFDGGSWSLRFDGVGSAESLNGYVWRYGAGETYHTAYEGSWDFSFQLEGEDLTMRKKPNVKTTWEGYELTVTALEISPYSLFLQYSADEATAQRMFPPAEWGTLQVSDWFESDPSLTLRMKDGTALKVAGGSHAPKGGTMAAVPPDTVLTEFEMQFGLEAVIDPEQIESVQIGSQTLSWSK